MAFTIFISSAGLVMHKHYCQNQLKSAALFVAAKSCQHQKMVTVACPIHGTMEVPAEDDDSCCDDQTEYLKADYELINYSFEISDTESLIFLTAFAHSFLEKISFNSGERAGYKRYKPPILLYDRQVRLQTFRC